LVGFGVAMIIAAVYAVVTRWASRRDDGGARTGLLAGFWSHLGGAAAPWALACYAVAVVATGALAWGGVDGPVQEALQRQDVLPSRFSWAVLMVGNFWPLVLALVLYFVGRRRDGARAARGVAAFQAVAAVFLVTLVLKVLTGRAPPHHFFDGEPLAVAWRTTADATDFSLRFWAHAATDGRFMWPSGHTASAIAVVSAAVACGPVRRVWAWVGYAAVALTALAMVDGDFHWTSDVVAGALIAHAIGWAIGRRVRAEARYQRS